MGINDGSDGLSGRAAWWTDLHFELLTTLEQGQVLEEWRESAGDCAIVTGDISHGSSVFRWLRGLAEVFARPIYFVLGNHDFYGTSITRQREVAKRACEEISNLVYLTEGPVVSLSPDTALVGHDGWGDMREGDWEGTSVRPPDLDEIEDLKEVALDRIVLRDRLRQLGDEAAGRLERGLGEALDGHSRVIVATHVPPFREASWYDGDVSTAPWLPFFCCRAVGDVLLDAAEKHPACELLVLCGHCHGTGDVRIRENLRVLTGGGEPCSPHVQRILDFV